VSAAVWMPREVKNSRSRERREILSLDIRL
jgi:hypothetical protein